MRRVDANINGGGAIYQLGCRAEQPTPWRMRVPSVVEWDAQLPCSQHGVSQMYVSLGGLPSMSFTAEAEEEEEEQCCFLKVMRKKEIQSISNKKMDWP